MFITEVRNTFTQSMPNRDAFGITEKFQFLMKFITELKRDSFHLKTAVLMKA